MPRIVPELRHTQFNDQGRRLRAVALARRSDYGMRVVFTPTRFAQGRIILVTSVNRGYSGTLRPGYSTMERDR